MRVHAGVQAVLNVLGKGVRRHGDNRYRAAKRIAAAADSAGRVKAVHHGHLYVHQDGVILAGFQRFEGFRQLLAVRIDGAFRAVHMQQLFQDFRVQFVVLGAQEALSVENGAVRTARNRAGAGRGDSACEMRQEERTRYHARPRRSR